MCEKDFDKTNRDMLKSWNVVVREQQQAVRLYCPDCWGAAKRVVEKYDNGEL